MFLRLLFTMKKYNLTNFYHKNGLLYVLSHLNDRKIIQEYFKYVLSKKYANRGSSQRIICRYVLQRNTRIFGVSANNKCICSEEKSAYVWSRKRWKVNRRGLTVFLWVNIIFINYRNKINIFPSLTAFEWRIFNCQNLGWWGRCSKVPSRAVILTGMPQHTCRERIVCVLRKLLKAIN